MPLILLPPRNPLSYPSGVAPGFDPTHIAAGNPKGSFVHSGGNFVNVLTGEVGVITAGNGTQAYTAKSYIGACLALKPSAAAGTGYVSFTNVDLTNYQTVTFGGIFILNVIGAASTLMTNSNSGTATGVSFRISNLTSHPTFAITGLGTAASSYTMIAGVPYFCAMSWNGATVNIVTLRLDTGQLYIDSGLALSGTPGTPTTGYIVGNVSARNQEVAGWASAVMMSSASLGLSQLLAWAADPWSFWYPQKNIPIIAAQPVAAAETNTHFSGRYRNSVLNRLPALNFGIAADDSGPTFQPETNVNFSGKFTPSKLSRLLPLSFNVAADDSFAQIQPETNPHFIGKFSPATFSLLTPLRHNIAADFTAAQVQPETNPHFSGKFSPTVLNRLLGLSLNIAADDSTAQTQPETNTNFVGKFRPDQIRLLPGLWQNPALELIVQPDTNPPFVGKFRPTVLTRLLALNYNTAGDISAPQVQPETNVNFRGKFKPTVFTLRPALAWNPSHSTTLPTQPATNVHFIGRFKPDRFMLLTWLRHHPARDVSAIHFCPDVIGDTASYNVIGDMAAYAVTGTAVGPNCGVGASDGIDSSTVLMLHMDGLDASTTFIDSSSVARTITPSGNAQIDTSQSKFGGAGGLFDGSGDWLDMAASVDFRFTGDFAIDFWIRPNSIGTSQRIIEYQTGSGMLINLTAAGVIDWFDTASGTLSTPALSAGTWYHYAAARVANNLRIFLNGVQQGGTLVTALGYGSTIFGPRIAAAKNGGSNFNGWLEEFRISNGNGRWSADFTPPTQAYSPAWTNCPVIGSMATYSVVGSGTLPRVC